MTHTASLEMSKRLAEAGVAFANSPFLYCDNPTCNDGDEPFLITRDRFEMLLHMKEVCPAPTLGEMVRRLPKYLVMDGNAGESYLQIHLYETDTKVGYQMGGASLEPWTWDYTPEDAVAQMLEWLAENNLLKEQEC